MYPRINKTKAIQKLLNHSEFRTKVLIFMSRKTAGEDFDTYEQNYTYTNLNPVAINAYVTEISPNALVYRTYGLSNLGAKDILCEKKYRTLFENCNKIQIDDEIYEVFKEGTGNKTLISQRGKNLIKVTVTRKD